jgi:hypothetical protein
MTQSMATRTPSFLKPLKIRRPILLLYSTCHILHNAHSPFIGRRIQSIRARFVPYGLSFNQVPHPVGWQLRYQMNGYTLIDFIQRRSLQYYAYNVEGSGCLTWTKRIIEELRMARYLPGHAYSEVENYTEGVRTANNNYWVPFENGAAFIMFDSY